MYWTGVESSPILLKPLIGLLYYSWMIEDDDMMIVEQSVG
jgi:hypothetical protein